MLRSALPSASKSRLFVTWPAVCLTLPFTSSTLPLISSFVLGFICFLLLSIVESCLIEEQNFHYTLRQNCHSINTTIYVSGPAPERLGSSRIGCVNRARASTSRLRQAKTQSP